MPNCLIHDRIISIKQYFYVILNKIFGSLFISDAVLFDHIKYLLSKNTDFLNYEGGPLQEIDEVLLANYTCLRQYLIQQIRIIIDLSHLTAENLNEIRQYQYSIIDEIDNANYDRLMKLINEFDDFIEKNKRLFVF